MLQIILLWAPDTLFGFLMFHNISENFLQIFRAFGVFFAALIIILDFSGIILSTKLINSENNKYLIFPNLKAHVQ